MLETRATRVARLRVRSDASDAPALRLAVERQLSGVEISTPGLAPSSLLVIRRLGDPLPGALDVVGDGFRPPAEWEAALEERVADLGRGAAWPERGESAGGARAVAFSDRAALAACLATDLVRGSVASRWWWQRVSLLLPELVRVPTAPTEVATLFVALAPLAPAIFGRLVAARAAVEVSSHVSESRVGEVVRAMAHTFALPRELELAPALDSTARSPGPPESAERPPTATYARAVLERARRDRAPWAGWVPRGEDIGTLSDAQHWLLGIGLGLGRATAVVRSASFAHRCGEWWSARAALVALRERGEPDGSGTEVELGPRAAARGVGRPGAATPAPPAGLDEPSKPGAEPAPPTREPGEGLGETGEPAGRRLEPVPAQERQPESESAVPPATREEPEVRLDLPATERAEEIEEIADASRDSFPGDLYPTKLGGVLYLVNVLRSLGVPESFEEGWEIPSRLGPWGAVELIGRLLLGESHAKHAADPVWDALRELRGEVAESEESPESDLDPPYRAPRFWSEVLEDEPSFLWAASRRRLRLWSSGGYVVASVARDDHRPSTQAAVELAAYLGETGAPLRRARLADAPLAPTGALENREAPELCRWAALVAPAVARRLRLAVGRVPRVSRPVERLLRMRAELFVTSSHVDLVADLAQIWMPARLAGLDRDPGWQPALGRVVQFHFD